MVDTEYGKITDQGIEELKDRIGVVIDEPQPHFEEATKDTIRLWTQGIGCNNPLYLNEDYAAKTSYGNLIAPPTFLYSTSRIISGYFGGLPGVHGMYGGADWEWHQPIRRGDKIETKSWLHDIEEKETRFAGRSVKQTYRTEFYNQNDDKIAVADSWAFRTERDTASDSKQKYEKENVEVASWDEEDIEKFADHYKDEEPRGNNPRYYEDVHIGDTLGPILKGPMSITNVIAFDQGWGGLYIYAHKRYYELINKHPALGIPNQHGVPEPPERVHWDHDFAQEAGVPAAYDYGPERISWLGHIAHHWMGDDGFLKNLYGEVRRHNLMGDITWCSGEVTNKRVEDGEHLIEASLEAVNQRDNVTAKGTVIIRLPSKEKKE